MTTSVRTSCSFGDYAATPARFDECKSSDGQVRPHWRPIADYLESLGPEGICERASTIEQLVYENGTTFNVDSDEGRLVRPWRLSAIPLVIDSQSWAKLETGLAQRTLLLEAVLDDLLGDQRLIKEKIIPAEVLWANPFFQRAYHKLPSTSGKRLHITATDLARATDGSWWVTSDRTRAPSGLGYLLENRIVTSRVFPQLVRQCNTRRLAAFFDSLRRHLRSLAPRMRENPRVALLTPGHDSYRDFEDAYLARYLGVTLVESTDLAVRGGQLNLKTLGGLLPIEVLWRHVSDRKCDPLELEPDSNEGVTGLLRAIRESHVAVVNSLGSVMAQTPALLPFLPAASRFLFSQPLQLPNVATYWCGGKKEFDFVLQHLETLVIRPAFAVSGAPPVSPSLLSQAAKDELVAAIKARPQEYVAQQKLEHSTTPVWSNEQLKPWHVALRCFQLQTNEAVEVLPGALARLSPLERELELSTVSGHLTMDCWVSSSQPIDSETTLLPSPSATIALKRSGDELPSRVAEHLFWLGRYAERAEAITRLLRATIVRISGESEIRDLPELPRLLAALAAVGQIEPDYAVAGLDGNLPSIEDMLPDSVNDLKQPRGLQSTIRSIVTNARSVRDRLSIDAYRIIQRIGTDTSESSIHPDENMGRVIERLNRLITDLLAFSGVANESMTRTHGWRFLQLGRRIERADQTAELLDATLVQPVHSETTLCEGVLEALDSLMTYRSRYLNLVRPAPTIDLLVTDETNPRSLRFQLQEIVDLITQLPTDSKIIGLGSDEKLASELLHQLRVADPTPLSEIDRTEKRSNLQLLLRRLIEGLPSLSDAIAARYLIHTGTTQALTGVIPTELS
ncbi:circularly permuted type 2 ATP-grasp protein [Novipirellula artificiosorum]|uniref:Uncharacterized protein n=1 Tax=Novipirellula artificiosorum TaxID=2528016 RepID=A0A5C6DFB9_9BACT|nr:circularly permuted type 2 ATP-grasp protein [Novipirellula artificiosorum]TWU35943.1 hypothetical protein Poly41_36950 [Novipirellula artificiosorum]